MEIRTHARFLRTWGVCQKCKTINPFSMNKFVATESTIPSFCSKCRDHTEHVVSHQTLDSSLVEIMDDGYDSLYRTRNVSNVIENDIKDTKNVSGEA